MSKTRQQRQAARLYRGERRRFRPHYRYQCPVCLQLASLARGAMCADCAARLGNRAGVAA